MAVRETNGRGRRYDSVVDTVGDTPVIRINRIAPDGVTVYVKFEAFNPAGSVKDRLALNIIEAAERRGDLKPGQTVVEATSVADKGGEVDHLVIDAPEMMRSLKMISFPPTMDEVVEVEADALEEEVGGTHINAKDTTTMMRVATMEVTTTNTVVTTTSMAGTTMQMVTTTMVMEVMAGGLAAEAGGAAVEGAEAGVAEVAVEDVAARQQLKAMKLEAMRANRMRPMILELKKAPRQTMLLKRLVSIPPQWFKQVLEDEEGAEEAVAEAEDEDGAFTEVEGAHFLGDLMLSI